jgi:colanic acid/amylovoran biosynthesis protein
LNILITNHSSSGNLGDASILESLIDELKEYNGGMQISIVANYLDHPISVSDDIITCKNPFMLGLGTDSLKAYQKADGVIIRGGDYLSNLYGNISLLHHVLTAYPAVLLHRPIAFIGHSFGPFSVYDPLSMFSKKLLRTELNHSQLITIREDESLKHIYDLVSLDKCHEVADSAFLLEPMQENVVYSYLLDLMDGIDFKNIVGINTSAVIPLYGFSQFKLAGSKEQCYVKNLAKFVDLVLNSFDDIAVVLIPHVMRPGNNDLRVSELVAKEAKSKERIRIVKNVCSPRLMKGIIGQLDFLIASRMHAMIHSISSGVPTLGVSYSHKVNGLMRLLGLNEYILDIREMSYDTLFRKFEEMWFNQDIVKKAFISASATARAKALVGKNLLFNWLTSIYS